MTEVMSPRSPSPPPRSRSKSPPSKCAICLGDYADKCRSDSCMHQFCFKCLVQWSRIKAECPLCKQPFMSILHNIKSDNEYDKYVVVHDVTPIWGGINDDHFYLPPAPPSRHFQFRTTFTVDPGGELAIQQMLLSHPLTSTSSFSPNFFNARYPSHRSRGHSHRASSATSFRRSIYLHNLWVYAPPDVTGRYRDTSPGFFRNNPAARNRLVPWLNRELNALLRENTQQVMHLVDDILELLLTYHIKSRHFRNVLAPYLTHKTGHFIHEFYNFMRSPFDMVGYDRNIIYDSRTTPSPTIYALSDQDDSDVTIVNTSELVAADNNPFRRPTLEVIEIPSDSSHDSDIEIFEPPPPPIVDLLDSTDTDDVIPPPKDEPAAAARNVSVSENSDQSDYNVKPLLPIKIRLKRKRQSREKRSKAKKKSKRRRSPSSSRSSSPRSEFSEDSTSSTSSELSKRRAKRKQRKTRYTIVKGPARKVKAKRSLHHSDSSSSDSDDDKPLQKRSSNSNSDDNVPLSQLCNRNRGETASASSCWMPWGADDISNATPSCSTWSERKVDYHSTSPGLPSRIDGPSSSLSSNPSSYMPGTDLKLENYPLPDCKSREAGWQPPSLPYDYYGSGGSGYYTYNPRRNRETYTPPLLSNNSNFYGRECGPTTASGNTDSD